MRISQEDVPKIAAHLRLTEEDFLQNHTRLTPLRNSLALLDKPNGECAMLEGNACRIQAVKPTQCIGFPNTWNLPGWQEICKAIPIELPDETPNP